ncbi:hypothetical protein [Acidovorax sp. LjRoot117]
MIDISYQMMDWFKAVLTSQGISGCAGFFAAASALGAKKPPHPRAAF